jgi:hypothetical protein
MDASKMPHWFPFSWLINPDTRKRECAAPDPPLLVGYTHSNHDTAKRTT